MMAPDRSLDPDSTYNSKNSKMFTQKCFVPSSALIRATVSNGDILIIEPRVCDYFKYSFEGFHTVP